MTATFIPITEEDKIKLTAKKTTELILMSQSKERWVTQSAYCARWSVSRSHVTRHHSYFQQHGAVDGEGKMIRYDKFFSPKSGNWIYS